MSSLERGKPTGYDDDRLQKEDDEFWDPEASLDFVQPEGLYPIGRNAQLIVEDHCDRSQPAETGLPSQAIVVAQQIRTDLAHIIWELEDQHESTEENLLRAQIRYFYDILEDPKKYYPLAHVVVALKSYLQYEYPVAEQFISLAVKKYYLWFMGYINGVDNLATLEQTGEELFQILKRHLFSPQEEKMLLSAVERRILFILGEELAREMILGDASTERLIKRIVLYQSKHWLVENIDYYIDYYFGSQISSVYETQLKMKFVENLQEELEKASLVNLLKVGKRYETIIVDVSTKVGFSDDPNQMSEWKSILQTQLHQVLNRKYLEDRNTSESTSEDTTPLTLYKHCVMGAVQEVVSWEYCMNFEIQLAEDLTKETDEVRFELLKQLSGQQLDQLTNSLSREMLLIDDNDDDKSELAQFIRKFFEALN